MSTKLHFTRALSQLSQQLCTRLLLHLSLAYKRLFCRLAQLLLSQPYPVHARGGGGGGGNEGRV